MAMSKADYARLGTDDASAGNQSRRPVIPGTWQYKAYMDAWETQHDEMAAPKSKLVEAFRRGMAEADRKVHRDIAKAQKAFFVRHAQRQRLAACDKALNRELVSRRRREFVSPNIRFHGE